MTAMAGTLRCLDQEGPLAGHTIDASESSYKAFTYLSLLSIVCYYSMCLQAIQITISVCMTGFI